jgi:hypothetical protein
MNDDQILVELHEINKKLDTLSTVIVSYIVKAEKEVPEYLRRLSMYYNDMFHMKILWEQSGQQLPAILRDEIDRTHHRLEECIQEEINQGGAFHKTMERYAKEGKNFAKRRAG